MSTVLYNPAIEQRVLIVDSFPNATSYNTITELNGLLSDGWQVVSVTSAGAAAPGWWCIQFFVILERRRSLSET